MSRSPLAPPPRRTRDAGYGPARDRVRALLGAERFRDALGLMVRLPDRYAADPDCVADRALCHWGLDEGQVALDLMRIAIRAAPDRADFHGRLGSMHLSLGQPEAARAALEAGLRLAPKSAAMLAALDRVAPLRLDDPRTERLRRITRSSRLGAADKATAANTLGRIEERSGNFPAAFRHFARANRLLTGRYDPGAIDRHVAAQQALFHPPPDLEPEGPRVVFVVGMPRSGTTLVESILARHPRAAGIGESQALPRALALCRAERLGPKACTAWDWQDGLTDADRARYRAVYLDHAMQRFPGDPPALIIDKLPLNALEAGFAAHILPDARIIHMSRQPLDVGLSCFAANFQSGNAFSRRLEWIGHLTGRIAASARDHAEKLGSAFRLQSYRALVEDPEPQIRALLDHVGLPFSAACLAPEKGGRIQRTASVLQLRRGINRDGLGKWQNHAADLAPLIEALGGAAAIEEWDRADRGGT